MKKHNKVGFYMGIGNSARAIYAALTFSVGLRLLVVEYNVDREKVFLATFFMMYSVMGLGFQAANIPSIGDAYKAAKPIFGIIDQPSTLDVRKTDSRELKTVTEGKIEFKDVTFNYPSRGVYVLRDMNLTIPAAHKVALVGGSGCGKSTITNLILQFYNIEQG